MFKHDYNRQLTAGERMAIALFHFEERFTAIDLADFVGISNHEARKRLHALEYFGVVSVVDEDGPHYQRADLAPDSFDEDGCDWCDSTDSKLRAVRAETELGDYMGLSGHETVHLCEMCVQDVSSTANKETTQTETGDDVLPIHPICQAEDCDQLAGRSISSEDGHPHEEWKLCPSHYNEVEGIDPDNPLGHDWTVRKLYYRCPSGGKISHNQVSEELDGRYHCPCGYVHIGVSVGE